MLEGGLRTHTHTHTHTETAECGVSFISEPDEIEL